MRVLVAVLCVIGLAAVAGRALFPTDAITRIEPLRRASLRALGLHDPLGHRRAADVAAMDDRFAAHRLVTALHIASAAIFILLLPFQLSPRLRAGHPAIHRSTGRLMVSAGLVMLATGLYFGLLIPFGGLGESVAIAAAGVWYLIATTRAVIAIRRRDIAHHRRWMLRAAAVPLGVSVIRLVGAPVEIALVGLGLGPRVLFTITVWLGFALSILIAELWVRKSPGPMLPARAQTVSHS